MQLTICGVRGSTPAPGASFVRYGGNTSCIAVSHRGSDPTLVIDAGTGLSQLSRMMNGTPFRGTILLGHLHWDHTHGLPFFPAGDRPESTVKILMPKQGDPEEILRRILAPPHFPITEQELRGDWSVDAIDEGKHEIEGFDVIAREIPHKGGRAFGFRISNERGTFAYLSDHSPISMGPGPEGWGEYHDAAMDLARGCDLLVHDAQYTAEEFPARSTWGHSVVDYAVGFAREAKVRKVLLFHHDPSRTDDELDAFAERYACEDIEVEVAKEQTVINLP